MRRRNRDGARKEKIIMALSSVFVLAALTATGLFIRGKNEDRSDGYVVDFSSIENNGTELAQNDTENVQEIAGTGQRGNMQETENSAVTADDLDYDPYYQETNSLSVENEEEETEPRSKVMPAPEMTRTGRKTKRAKRE